MTNITLNAGQAFACDNILHAIINHEDARIEAAAGYGKTTTIKAALARSGLEKSQVYVLAPTNSAVKNLAELEDFATLRTVASFCRLRMQEDRIGDKVISTTEEGDSDATPEYPRVIVVDEASMLSQSALNLILQRKGPRTSLILVGDPNQLEPVGDTVMPAFAQPVARDLRLTENMRAKKAGISGASDYFRNAVMSGAPAVNIHNIMHFAGQDGVYRDTIAGMRQSMAQYRNAGHLDNRIICFTNAASHQHNDEVHRLRFGIASIGFQPGEQIVAREPLYLDGEPVIVSGDLGFVTHVGRPQHLTYELGGMQWMICVMPVTIDFPGLSGWTFNIPRVAQDWETLNQMTTISRAVLTGDMRAIRYDTQKSLVAVINDNLNSFHGGDVVKRMGMIGELCEARKQFVRKISLHRHSYASTCHNIQGQSIQSVFVDVPNLLRARDQVNRMAYVAVSRAREQLILGC